eukprot:141443-Hanusia_phi.AAC.2
MVRYNPEVYRMQNSFLDLPPLMPGPQYRFEERVTSQLRFFLYVTRSQITYTERSGGCEPVHVFVNLLSRYQGIARPKI